MTWVTLIILELIPIILWISGWYFENKSTKYPDTSKGFKRGIAVKNEETWIYANKVASKIFSVTGNILFLFIAIGILLLGINIIVIAFIIFISICADFFIIEGIIKKKFKNQ